MASRHSSNNEGSDAGRRSAGGRVIQRPPPFGAMRHRPPGNRAITVPFFVEIRVDLPRVTECSHCTRSPGWKDFGGGEPAKMAPAGVAKALQMGVSGVSGVSIAKTGVTRQIGGIGFSGVFSRPGTGFGAPPPPGRAGSDRQAAGAAKRPPWWQRPLQPTMQRSIPYRNDWRHSGDFAPP